MLKQHEKDEACRTKASACLTLVPWAQGDKPSADQSPASEAKAEPAEPIHVEDVPSEPARAGGTKVGVVVF